MTKILLDSSIYLSIFLKDSMHGYALKLISPYLDNINCTIYLPTIIIAEVINTLNKTNTKETAINNFISTIMSSERYKIINSDLIFYIKNIRNNSKNIKLKTSDLIIFSIAKEYGIDKLISIDKKLSNTQL